MHESNQLTHYIIQISPSPSSNGIIAFETFSTKLNNYMLYFLSVPPHFK
jgi:hypothetical protein